MTSLVLTLVGPDRPGLVSAVSAAVEAHGGAWLQSQLARLADTFAGVVLVSVPDSEVDALEAELVQLAGSGLEVRLRRAHAATSVESATWQLALVGQDHPGIIAGIAAVLARHGVGFDELSTSITQAPMGGGELFHAQAVLTVPSGRAEEVRSELEGIATDLMVDLDLAAD